MKNKALTFILAIICIVALGVGGFFGFQYIQKDIAGDRGTNSEYTLNIEPSDFAYEIGAKLKQGGIVKNDTLWCNWMSKHYPDFVYINGEYYLDSTMSYEELASKLTTPDISHKTISVCIPEGYNVFDIADTLADNNICDGDAFLEACKDATPYMDKFDFLASPSDSKVAYALEGFLFPATYDMQENSQPEDVIEMMLEAFDYKVEDSWTAYCEQNNMTLFELVTLASIVEKETLGDGVNEKIASVFINRLDAGQKLQSDVTIFYGNALREAGFKDEIVTSYNTYKCLTLPSGPVCSPGVENIEAVINHADTDYYYFFSDLDNQFHFAKNYDEFSSLLNKYPWE